VHLTQRSGHQGFNSSHCIVIYSCGRVGVAQDRYTRVSESVKALVGPGVGVPAGSGRCLPLNFCSNFVTKDDMSVTRVTCEPVSAVKFCVDDVQPGTFHVSARTEEAVSCIMALRHWITRSRRFEGLYFLQLQRSPCPKEHISRTYRPLQMKELQFFVRSGTAHLGAQCRIPNHTALKASKPALRSTLQVKGKTVPLQAWSGPEGSRKPRFPDFLVVSLTHLPPGNNPGTHFF
jgi:hypothetical protein